MTSVNHTIFSSIMTFACCGSPLDVAWAALTARVPNQLEAKQEGRVLEERGRGHDLAIYFVLTFVYVFALQMRGGLPDFLSYGVWRMNPWLIMAGPIFHILADVFTPGGVRFCTIQIRIPVYITTSHKESIFTYTILSVVFFERLFDTDILVFLNTLFSIPFWLYKVLILFVIFALGTMIFKSRLLTSERLDKAAI